MNKTTIYISIVVVIVLTVTGYFLWNDLKSPVKDLNQEDVVEQENQDENIEPEEIELVSFVEDEFEIKVPSVWKELAPPEGIKAMVTYIDEEQIDLEKEKSGFRTYLAVTFDSNQGKNNEEFVQYVKDILIDSLPSIEFTNDESMVIDGRTANAIEAVITQEGYEFKTLLVMINGEGEDMWTLSFNTAEIRWEDSKDLFYEMANSFKIK